MATKIYDSLNFITNDFLTQQNWSIVKSFDNEKELYSVCVSDKPFSGSSFSRDLIYIEMAKVWAKNSYCERMQVGCLIVKEKSIISDGYNGTPTGFPNVCEDDYNSTLPLVLHAEANAITKLARGTQSSDGSILYVTLSPCFECSKLIIQSGIKKVVFLEVYRNPEPISFLAKAGIEIFKLTL